MKRGYSFLLVSAALVFGGFAPEKIWIIHPESELAIYGVTNINKFICRTACYNGSDTLRFNAEAGACEIVFTRNQMSIPVKSFDCGARRISSDFWSTLQADRYPRLEIRLRSLQTNALRDNGVVRSLVDIILAGKTKRYSIVYKVGMEKGNIIRLRGSQTVQFSDFGLTPPQKLNGLIKVNEHLDVEFNLVIREL